MEKRWKKGMVFGVFDGVHEGHIRFLSAAKEICEKLAVAVSTDGASASLKGRVPQASLGERIKALEKLDSQLLVLRGDEELGSWKVLSVYEPDIVILGYDQQSIGTALAKHAIPYIYMEAYEPERFKSSILKQEKKP